MLDPKHPNTSCASTAVEKDFRIAELEKKLAEANQKFEILTRATNEAIRDCDLGNDVVKWNHGITSLFGHNEAACAHHRFWSENIHPADYEDVMKELHNALAQQKQNWSAIYRFRCASGSYKYIYERGYIIYDTAKPIRMLGTMQDIDERMTIQAELERLSLVASKTDNLVVILDAEGLIEWVNDAFVSRVGYLLQEVIGKTMRVLQGPETDIRSLRRISSLMKKREPITAELLNYTKTGASFWVRISINPVMDDSQNLSRWVMVQTDISVHKEYERKIGAIAHELSDLIENANAVIFGVDLKLNVSDWNTCAALTTGHSREDVLGKKIDGFLFNSLQRDSVKKLLRKVLDGELVNIHEFPISQKNGQLTILLISAMPRRNASGAIVGLIAVGQDITELAQYKSSLEEKVRLRTAELNVALEKEKELSTLRTRFASMVSHEFRTPLATIRLSASLIKRYKKRLSPASVDAKVNTVLEQVEHMSHLLENVLTLGKSEDVKIQITKTNVDLISFCTALKKQMEGVFNESHTIELSFSQIQHAIETDADLLRNIFVNLLSNAIKFSPGKTAVYLHVFECGKNVVIEIKDEGIGIPAHDLERVFEPFDRGSNTGAIAGTGLGLSIVKKALDLAGGSIAVRSNVGEGTVFSVTLPTK